MLLVVRFDAMEKLLVLEWERVLDILEAEERLLALLDRALAFRPESAQKKINSECNLIGRDSNLWGQLNLISIGHTSKARWLSDLLPKA